MMLNYDKIIIDNLVGDVSEYRVLNLSFHNGKVITKLRLKYDSTYRNTTIDFADKKPDKNLVDFIYHKIDLIGYSHELFYHFNAINLWTFYIELPNLEELIKLTASPAKQFIELAKLNLFDACFYCRVNFYNSILDENKFKEFYVLSNVNLNKSKSDFLPVYKIIKDHYKLSDDFILEIESDEDGDWSRLHNYYTGWSVTVYDIKPRNSQHDPNLKTHRYSMENKILF